MNIPILADIAVIFGLSIVILYACHRLGIPGVVGFLLTGILAGSHGLNLVAAEEVDVLAEIGVILLMFSIGIEFSLKSLLDIRRALLLGGAWQVGLTTGVVTAIALLFGFGWNESLFFGFLASLSSTAIVLKALQDRSELDSPYGRTTLALLIFQDIVVVLMMLVTPTLAGLASSSIDQLLLTLGKALGLILAVLIGARFLVPRLLEAVAFTKSRELFLLTIVVLCFTIAWLTSLAGLSLALGAFLAGLIISESEYSHQAFSNVLPFRDIFTSLFFISVGLLVDSTLFIQKPLLIIAGTVGVTAVKLLVTTAAVLVLGFPLRVALLTGLCLSQIGEFSFLLSKTGLQYGLMTENTYGVMLAISVLTMAATPFLIRSAPSIVERALRLPWPNRLLSGLKSDKEIAAGDGRKLENHLVIVGYGLNGTNVTRAARHAKAAYAIIELNAELVRLGRKRGEPIYFGDATRLEVLEHAGIRSARVAVVVVSDPLATRGIVSAIRSLNPTIHIIARTRFFREAQELRRLGANEVIPEEYETSVEIFTRVLECYSIPNDSIQAFISEIRAEGYEMLRSPSGLSESRSQLPIDLTQVEVESVRVEAGSKAAGQSLAELNMRKNYGVTVLAIRRDSDVIGNPRASERLQADDIVTLFGRPSRLRQAQSMFANRTESQVGEEG